MPGLRVLVGAGMLVFMPMSAYTAPAAPRPPVEGVVASVPAEGIQVSLDGVDFRDPLSRPLFAGAPVVVPGDSMSASLWVRNAGASPATVRLSGTDAWSTSAELAAALLVSAGAPGARAAEALPLGAASGCALLLTGPVLEPGSSVALTVTVAFSPDARGREAQDARAGLDFVAALRDPADGAGPSADCAGGAVVPAFPGGGDEGLAAPGIRSGAIASTGLPVALVTLVAAALLGAGIAVTVAHPAGRALPHTPTRPGPARRTGLEGRPGSARRDAAVGRTSRADAGSAGGSARRPRRWARWVPGSTPQNATGRRRPRRWTR
ncbi:hypothetical protein VD659_13870 [Herbiconiux sp. 11R-BC]|uniref:hypothetical protein n=1 Tax=Herbiconiux sp. 11R-BC TaxID=3111637 RepID=UPI003C101518